jgi:hypothetical protein
MALRSAAENFHLENWGEWRLRVDSSDLWGMKKQSFPSVSYLGGTAVRMIDVEMA